MALGDRETRRRSVVSGGARRRRRQRKGEEGGAVASASAWARGRKLDRASTAGKRGKCDREEREGGGARWRGRNILLDGGGERGGAGTAGEGREGEKGEKNKGEKEKKERGGKYPEK